MSFPIGMVSARGACPCLLIQTKQQPLVLRAEAQGGNQGYGFKAALLTGNGIRHMTNGTPMAYEMWMMELLAAGLLYADAESILTVEAGR